MATLMSIFKKDEETTPRKSHTVTLKQNQGLANTETDENLDQENNPNQQANNAAQGLQRSKTRVITVKDGGVKETSNANEENKTPMAEVKQQPEAYESKGKKEKRKRKKNRKNGQF